MTCQNCNGKTAGGCAYCRQQLNNPYGHATPIARGCICPPTSEKTCQSPTCPRQGLKK